MLDFYGELKQETSRLETKETILGKASMQPFAASNSGNRKIMQGVQLEHAMAIRYTEPPYIGTGYENRYGDRSSSIITADSDYKVMAKIPKFTNKPDGHYFLILKDLVTGEYDYHEVIEYAHTSEAYGWLYDNSAYDNLEAGYEIPKGEILRKTYSYDEHMNRCDGVNLLTGYIAKEELMEDEIEISESAQKKLVTPLVKVCTIPVNENDIFLNRLGDDYNYKAFPDVGEEISDGILCSLRREKIEECLFAQSVERLKHEMMSDTNYTIKGTVIDIDIKCNSPEIFSRFSNQQLANYYNDKNRFNDELVNTVNMLADREGNIQMSYRLKKLVRRAQREMAGDLFVNDKPKPYKGALVKFTVLEMNLPIKGDKVTNRYGGKGVIVKVVPDEQMPMLDDGRRLEICFNSSTCVNRLNPGQLKEMSLNFCSSRILQYINETPMTTDEAIDLIYNYMSIVSPEEAEEFFHLMYNSGYEKEDRDWYIDNMVDSGHILLSIRPITENVSLDILREIYRKFPFIKQYDVVSPIKDSNGNTRYIKGRRPLVCGETYIYRLKQYAEEKFIVTSLSATNIKNENTKSKANKNYRSLHANTPIRFGNMEVEHMGHMGAEPVIEALMIHSVSPQGRRLYEQALTGDPYNINIKLDDDSRNRQAEILNARLKAMGLKLVFNKIPKKNSRAFNVRAFTRAPKINHAFLHVSEEEMKTLNIDYYLDLRQDVYDKIKEEKAFSVDAFKHLDDIENM